MAAAAAAAPAGVRAGAGDGGEVFFFSARSPSPLLMAAAALAEAAGPGPSRPDPVPGGPDPDPRLPDLSWRPTTVAAAATVGGAHACAGGQCFLICRPSPHGLGCCGSGAGCARGSDLCRPACPRRPVWRSRRTVSAAMVKTEASALAGGAGFGAWRSDSAASGHGGSPTWWGTLAVMTAATSAGARADDVGQMRPRCAAV